MKVVTASTLRNSLSDLFREIEVTGEEILVTDEGEFVLKIISYRRYTVEQEPACDNCGNVC